MNGTPCTRVAPLVSRDSVLISCPIHMGSAHYETAALVIKVLPTVFPWMRFLPDSAAQEFAAEFAETARASAELGNMTPLGSVIEAWRATAEVHADRRCIGPSPCPSTAQITAPSRTR